jgi:hypothetical protein
MPNARTSPIADRRPPEVALREVLLAEHAKLTKGRLTRRRRDATASCGRLLFKLELLAELEPVR